jgi:hypothetical protein
MNETTTPLSNLGDGFSAEIGELAAALSKAQGAMRAAAKDAKNPHLKNAYADLNGIITASREAMTANGLSCTQLPSVESTDNGMRIVLVTLVLHASGQWLRNVLRLPVEQGKGINLKQATGAAISYARRYALSSIMGVATGDDTDGAVQSSGPTEDDIRKAHLAGAAAGRRWAVSQILLPARGGYTGAGFAAKVRQSGIGHNLEQLKLYCLWIGNDKPSQMGQPKRDSMLTYLATDAGKDSWTKFAKECGPLPTKPAPDMSR